VPNFNSVKFRQFLNRYKTGFANAGGNNLLQKLATFLLVEIRAARKFQWFVDTSEIGQSHF
jgi:hypothetical protein